MPEGKPDFLTVRELAAFLRVKERKVYALAASGEIPCSRATGKLIFPRAAVEAWVSRHSSGAAPAAAAVERPLVFVGSHDPLLDWALRESRSGLASFFDGSLDGLARLRSAQAVAAGVHLYEPAAEGWNRAHVEDELAGEPVVLLEWAWRDRGFIVAEGNPKKISAFRNLTGKRFVPRQAEAGSQVLFQSLLERERIGPASIDIVGPAARSESDVAAAISEGKADVGFGLGRGENRGVVDPRINDHPCFDVGLVLLTLLRGAIRGVDVGALTRDQRALLRRHYIGFVFQGFNLLPRTSALENVELPLIYRGTPGKERRALAAEALRKVGLSGWEDHDPNQLSGGQQQRVAVARAIVTKPALLLADEPTGNLDTAKSHEIMQLLTELNRDDGITIVMVTHEPDMADYASRMIHFVDGRVESDSFKKAAA